MEEYGRTVRAVHDELSGLDHGGRKQRLYSRTRPLSPVRRLGLPLRASDGDRAKAEGTGRRCRTLRHRVDIDATIDAIFEPVNNGVYRSGFATTQEAVPELFGALDHWEEVLSSRRYLCGDRLTEADWCLFPTLVRFDSVYHGHFKCNLRRIVDYPNLWGHLKDLYQQPGVADTVYIDHIKKHYYGSHESINPTRIVPKGPILDFTEPHDRGLFSDQTPQGNGYTRSA